MDQVFAPWRIEWIERERPPSSGCVFCELPEEREDEEHLLVARSERAYVLLNNYPYNPGHAMVIPREHTGEYSALDEAALLDHATLTQRTIEAIDAALSPDGFNTGMNLGEGAGGSIGEHLHTHVVPRWAGDTNFMAVIADTKVIVEALADTYERVHAAFGALDEATGTSEGGAVELAFE